MRVDARTVAWARRLAIRGALVASTGFALYVVLGSLAGEQNAPMFAVPLVVAVGFAYALHRSERAVLPALVLGIAVSVILAMDPFRLSHPDNFLDFASPLLSLAGSIATSLGAALVLVERRRPGWDAPIRLLEIVTRTGTVVVVGLVLLSAVLTATPSAPVPGGADLVVEADASLFRPDEVTAAVGETILVRNTDWFAHTFTVRDLGIDLYVAPRAERLVELDGAPHGRYELTCEVLGHWEMDGILQVAAP